ncbi:MAG: hypothetical protein CR972_03075 [Candidatus Moraniibacteriota bacterium]|nr:MAG: hypothetical protein CR972_03075 [Candidatus Moranbacteria bacterium]
MKFFNIFKKKIVADCGHKTLKKDNVTAFGESCEIAIPISNGKTAYCHRCLEKMAIRCAWCGKVIFIGDPITLYSPRGEGLKMPDYAVLYNEEHSSYVGCLRWDCAETGADRAGFWHPPGKVFRVATPLEMCLHNLQSGGNGIVTIKDIGDFKEATKCL